MYFSSFESVEEFNKLGVSSKVRRWLGSLKGQPRQATHHSHHHRLQGHPNRQRLHSDNLSSFISHNSSSAAATMPRVNTPIRLVQVAPPHTTAPLSERQQNVLNQQERVKRESSVIVVSPPPLPPSRNGTLNRRNHVNAAVVMMRGSNAAEDALDPLHQQQHDIYESFYDVQRQKQQIQQQNQPKIEFYYNAPPQSQYLQPKQHVQYRHSNVNSNSKYQIYSV